MTEFAYKGRNAQGKIIKDHVTANSDTEAAKILLLKGITPITVERILETGPRPSSHFFSQDIFASKVRLTDLIMFSRQMAALTKAGMPIGASLLRLSETTKSAILRNALRGVSQEVLSGKTLSLSVAQFPKIFSPIFVNMIDTGEHTGKLDEAFSRLTEYLELEASVKRRIKAIMRYPTIVITAIMVATSVINVMVIPAFANMFKRFGAQLPLPTRVLLASSNFTIQYWPHVLVGVFVVILGLRLYVRTPAGRYSWDYFKLRIPLFGDVILQVLLMRFSSLFAMIFSSGVPLSKGMALVANAVGNQYVRKNVLTIRDGIESGESLYNSTKNSRLFPPLVTQMISVGEESGTLDVMLLHVAAFYREEVDYKIKQLGDLMEPILLVIVACMVLVLALGVFLPMWDMVKFVH